MGLTKYCGLVCAFCHNLAFLVFIPDKKEIADYSDQYRLWFTLGSFCNARLSKHEWLQAVYICLLVPIQSYEEIPKQRITCSWECVLGRFLVVSSDYIPYSNKMHLSWPGTGPHKFCLELYRSYLIKPTEVRVGRVFLHLSHLKRTYLTQVYPDS